MDCVGHLLQIRVVHCHGIGGAGVGPAPVIAPGHVLRGVGDLRPAAEAAVHQDFRKFSSIGQGRGIWRVLRPQGLAGGQVSIVQLRPGRGISFFRGGLRQGFDPLPVLEGNHGHGDAVGHKGQLQPGKQLRHPLRAAQGVKIHRLRLPGVADAVQRAQALAGKGIAGDGAAAVHVSRHGAQIGGALVDGHQGVAVYQGGPQPGHAAHIVSAGQAALAPAVPDAAPGGPGDAAYIVAVTAGDSAVILAVSDPSQIHQADDAAGVVLLAGDLSRIDAGGDHGLGLIPEVQRAVALLDQVVLRIKVVLNGHGTHDPGHIDIPLHRPVIPGVGQIPRICGLRRFV